MTPGQNACLQAIRELTVDGVSPTYSQICERLGLASKSGVLRMVDALERQGFVRRDPHRHRSLAIVERRGAAISDARIAAMSDEALESALHRINAALLSRRNLAA